MIYSLFYNTLFNLLRRAILPVMAMIFPKVKRRKIDADRVFRESGISKRSGEKIVWFHAASMGEFEQAKPVIERIKLRHENVKILVTFLSPSGYENQKLYPYADCITYLPDDYKSNVTEFFDKMQPDIAVFVRYDLWFNYLREAKRRDVPLVLIAATNPVNKILEKVPVYNCFARLYFNDFRLIFTIGSVHTEYFRKLKLTETEIVTASDPRFDRISELADKSAKNEIIRKARTGSEFKLVLGSSWDIDEDMFIYALSRINDNSMKVRCIFVPHEPTQEHIGNLCKKVNAVLLSALLEDETLETGNNHIVVDSIGKLLYLYSLADAAYIGGGFGAGLHSVTEPAGYGIPLSCGPKIEKSPDAIELVEEGALRVISSKEEAYDWINYVLEKKNSIEDGIKAKRYIQNKLGSSEIIHNHILDLISN